MENKIKNIDSKKIFISSTLRTKWNRDYNLALCKALEERSLNCFLPQRDVDTTNNATIANNNISAINNCKVLISVGFNESPNLGFEAGYAYGINKPIIIIRLLRKVKKTHYIVI